MSAALEKPRCPVMKSNKMKSIYALNFAQRFFKVCGPVLFPCAISIIKYGWLLAIGSLLFQAQF